MKPTTANHQPNSVDPDRERRKSKLYRILCEEGGTDLSMLNQFALVPATWTLAEYKQAIEDLVMEDAAGIRINPNDGVIGLM